MKRMRPEEVLKLLLNQSFTRVKPTGGTQKVSTKWLGYLVMESLCAYARDPMTFGQNRRSFDAVMKGFIEQNGLNSRRSRRGRNLAILLDAYYNNPSNRPGHKYLSKRKVGRSSADKYFERKARTIFKSAVTDMRSRTIDRKQILPDGIFLERGVSTLQSYSRHIQADLQSVIAENRSEASDDEIYLLTGAMLLDSTGKWNVLTDGMRDDTGDIDAPPPRDVDFPDHLNPLFAWNILKPPNNAVTAPVYAVASITVMEHDNTDRDRVIAAFEAAYETAKLIASLVAGTAGGPVGIAIAIANILYNVIIALDGDDLLGTAEYRFDNVLAAPAPKDFQLDKYILGTQHGNPYRYVTRVRYRSEDFAAPTDFSCRIVGASYLSLVAGGVVKAPYKVVVSSIGNTYVQLEDIKWKVTPATGQTRVTRQGQRHTHVQFDMTGSFVVEVTVTVAGTDQQLTDTHRVGVDLSDVIPP
jgi:hypothetical protein